MAFSTFLTSYSSFKKQALACDYNLDARQELYALGAAGVFGSFFGAFPPSGSLSRTGLAVQLGVKSQICGICTAATVAAGLIFLAPALEDLPKASLAAIVMVSAEGLMDFQMPWQLWNSAPQTFRSFRKDLVVWMVGFLCTILAGALYGIVLSVLVAIAQVVAEAATPKAGSKDASRVSALLEAFLGELPCSCCKHLETEDDAQCHERIIRCSTSRKNKLPHAALSKFGKFHPRRYHLARCHGSNNGMTWKCGPRHSLCRVCWSLSSVARWCLPAQSGSKRRLSANVYKQTSK